MTDLSARATVEASARGLRALSLNQEYRTDVSDLARDLWVPCLSVAVQYDRAVGYFTSSGLAAASTGLATFVGRQGVMRIVASPVLQSDDVEALHHGLKVRNDVLARILLRSLADDAGDEVTRRLAYLSWLIAEGRLHIRVAVPNPSRLGLFHEKVAVFHDAFGGSVAVVGSPNETAGGLIDNFESVDVFTSWSDDAGRVIRKASHFERLWDNVTRGLEVVDLPTAVERRLVELAPPSMVKASRPKSSRETALTYGNPVALRPYQAAAIDAWEAADRHGILAMATGTGKTVTALAAASRLRDASNRPIAVVILAPLIHLVRQWSDAARAWGFRPIECFGSSGAWLPKVQAASDYLRAGSIDSRCLVSTHATASLAALKGVLASVPSGSLLVVADEMHHLGSDLRYSALPPTATYRLGLSATPERHDDVEGTTRLFDYFGGLAYEFGLQEAIEQDVLSHYDYEPILVPLTPDELLDYEEVSTAIGSQLILPPAKRDYRSLTRLMRERSSVLNNASGKMAALRTYLTTSQPKNTLVYCSNRKQLAATMDLMWDRAVSARQFTGEEDSLERASLLSDFARGRTPVLAAIRCLDEGVDVPEAERAHLMASSGNPLQFVQRRGRLLRRSEGKRRAVIVDYVTVPGHGTTGSTAILARELQRVVAFASSSDNRVEALEVLWPVLREHGLLYLLGAD